MANNSDEHNAINAETGTTDIKAAGSETATWQLNALTEALGDLTLAVTDSLSVGRGSDNDVVLGSKQVSRNHALLSVLNGMLYIKDLDSSNGTFINDERIDGNKSKQLKADDTVGFASFSFQVIALQSADIADVDTAMKNASDIGVEQPSVADNNIADTEPTSVDIPSIEKVDEEVINSDMADSKATDIDVIDSTIIDADVIEDPLAPTETPAKALQSSEDSVSDKVANPIDEPEVSVAVEPVAASPVESIAAEEKVLDSTAMDNTTIDSSVIDQPVAENAVVDTTVDSDIENKTEEPVIKETIVEEVLSSTVSAPDAPIADLVVEDATTSTSMPSTATKQEPVMSTDASKETLNKEPVIDEPLMKGTAEHQEPIVTPEHDKTTKTELQEEADPDVLRAKQAATGQLSGTANLGQAHDIGTEGNNAMDQAIDNSANAGHVEKKPSGGWFIWVFVAIVIIGLALWLFNMGGA
ncbi:FHA domain-containing protein [Psychrobacter sp. CAL346-MNA-CIBAN-0220]|uniref:FHA domain-containing protein n=1 Tax=Psychrobacter sp. CAL346-MNA-CIBAN-0220 TaxID=3140457 RepID=UPI00332EF5F8